MPSRRPHVLMIHDDELMCDFVMGVLEPAGYAVETSVPAASVSRLAVGDTDLVLLDLGWPESSGLELCMQLRAAAGRARVPIVALTDFPAETRDVLAFSIGPDEYLVKPFTLDELLAVVSRHGPPDASPALPG